MKVGVFTPGPDDPLHARVLDAFFQGLSAVDVEAFVRTFRHADPPDAPLYAPCDIAVVFGVFKRAVPTSVHRGRVFAQHRAQGKDVLVLERGFMRRDRYFMAGWNGINGRADFNLAAEMPDDRWRALETDLAPLRVPDGPTRRALLICQIPWDASVQSLDHPAWAADMAARLLAAGHAVTVRRHPLLPQAHFRSGFARLLATPGVTVSEETLAHDFAWADMVVTHNSNTAVDAVLEGLPVLVGDPAGSMARDVAVTDPAAVAMAYRPDGRPAWAHRLAWCQWTVEEIAAGQAWRHLVRGRTAG
jgi:hypothetical protein